jgi:hypothetical protein
VGSSLRGGGLFLFAVVLCTAGCGSTKSFEATEQLLLSDAVDESIAAIDFRPLSGFKVYLDTQYIRNVKGLGFVNAEYVISALRQQLLGAGCLLQESQADADLIIEARVGTLGSDAFQVTYGIPQNSALATAAQAISTLPSLPVLPELSLARRESREGAAKIAAFAYDRVTRQPVWQSGIARSSTTARDTWVLGVGPIQTGTVRKGARVVGAGLRFRRSGGAGSSPRTLYDRPPVNYNAEVRFDEGTPLLGPSLNNESMIAAGGQADSAAPAEPPASAGDKGAEADSPPSARVAERPEE